MMGSEVPLSGGRPISVWDLENPVLMCPWSQLNQVPRAGKHKGVRLRKLISRTENNTGRQGPCMFGETQEQRSP